MDIVLSGWSFTKWRGAVSQAFHWLNSLALGRLFGGDLVGVLASDLKVMASCDGSHLRRCLSVPERDLAIQCCHGELQAIRSVGHRQA